MDIWPTVHAERKALADDLRNLGTEDWARPSLCGNWTVRDVLAHMTSGAKLTPPAFYGKMIGSGFSFDKVQEKGVAANRGASPADTLANFESVVTSVKHPPGPRHPAQIPDRGGRDGGGLLQGLEPAHRLQESHRRAHVAGHRRELEPRHRPRGVGPHPVTGHGDDRPQAGGRRPGRRRCGHAAVALLTRLRSSPRLNRGTKMWASGPMQTA